MPAYVKPSRFSLRSHPEFSEKWVQDRIAEDPTILGLGDLVLRDVERIQPRAGRLDLLLQDVEAKRRYEVEIQLGATDESHIIRTIEYWDIERKRYPQYEHRAVIVAEDITSRFLNVISLFNGSVPLIAIQMQAMNVGEHTTLVFSTVISELVRGVVDEDEDAAAAPTDRAYWEARAAKATLAMADDLLGMAKEIDPALGLKFNKFYIGLSRDGQAFNFITIRPKKNFLLLEVRLPETSDLESKLEKAGIDAMEYDQRWGNYRLRLNKTQLSANAELLREMMREAYSRRAA